MDRKNYFRTINEGGEGYTQPAESDKSADELAWERSETERKIAETEQALRCVTDIGRRMTLEHKIAELKKVLG